jgi:hypothetical protein
MRLQHLRREASTQQSIFTKEVIEVENRVGAEALAVNIFILRPVLVLKHTL